MAYQDAVDRMVDLGEVGGPEVDLHAEFGQGVIKRRRIGREERRGRIRPGALQPELHAVLQREPA